MTLPGPEDDIRTVRGRTLVLPIVLVVALAVGIVSIYKLQEKPGPVMRFEHLGPATNATLAAAGGNATVLAYKPVHDAYWLEQHLETAILYASSAESDPLRVDAMDGTLRTLAGHPPPWLVVWDGHLLRVTLAG